MKLINDETLRQAADTNSFNGNPLKKQCFMQGAEYAEIKILPQMYDMLTWASKNNYEPIHDGRWVKRFMSFTISSEELFNKWLKERNEN